MSVRTGGLTLSEIDARFDEREILTVACICGWSQTGPKPVVLANQSAHIAGHGRVRRRVKAEQPSAAPKPARSWKLPMQNAVCEWCGEPLPSNMRSDSRFCRPAHAKAARKAKARARARDARIAA